MLALSLNSIIPEVDKVLGRASLFTLDQLTPLAYLDAPAFRAYRDVDAKRMTDVVQRIGKLE